MRYVTRHAESRAVLRDTEHFSNASGLKAPGVDVPIEDRLLGELDPPRHTAVRRVMVTAMTPKVVHAAEPFIHETARSLLAAARTAFRFRLVVQRGAAEPRDRVSPRFRPCRRRSTRALGQGADGEHVPGAQPHRTRRWLRGCVSRIRGLHRRAHRGAHRRNSKPAAPADDVLAPPHHARRRRRAAPPPPAPRARSQPHHRRPHHNEPAARQFAARRSSPIARLEDSVRADPAHLDNAIEESLRLTPPLLFLARACVARHEIGGCPVHTGERVIVGCGSANRDERVFDDADAIPCRPGERGSAPHVRLRRARVSGRDARSCRRAHRDRGSVSRASHPAH